jgi:hypothetical protein
VKLLYAATNKKQIRADILIVRMKLILEIFLQGVISGNAFNYEGAVIAQSVSHPIAFYTVHNTANSFQRF